MEGIRKFTFYNKWSIARFSWNFKKKKLVISVEPLDIYTVPLMSKPSKTFLYISCKTSIFP